MELASVLPSRAAPPDWTVGCRRWLQVLGLYAVGVMQPLLDAIVRNDAFRDAAQLGWPEWLVLWLGLGVVIPAAAMGLDALLRRLAGRIGGTGRNLLLHFLAFLAFLSVLRPFLTIPLLRNNYIVWLVSLIAASGLTALFAWFYGRSRWLGEWLALAGLGVIVFPAMFLLQLAHPWSSTALEQPVHVGRPVPVVMVVFDEFTGVSLMTEHQEIDARRFPQLARLAAATTWYRNATSVHPRTHLAVPAMLTGRYPQRDQLPDLALYPDNLLALIAHSQAYEMFVLEPLTRLCPEKEVAPRPVISFRERLHKLFHAAVAIYPRLILPQDLPLDLPVVPAEWFGRGPFVAFDTQQVVGRFTYGWNFDRNVQLSHFLTGLRRSERPRFCFLHVALPHYPWCYLASGEQYEIDPGSASMPPATVGDLGEDWTQDAPAVLRCEHRYLQQVGYVDRFLGQLQDRLRESGLWDECLLIVAADHGVSFRPGHSRRIPDSENLADLMSVPLFVKLPGQSSGGVDDRNVETIDIAPTIADVLQISPAGPFDGESLLQPGRRLRKTFYWENLNGQATVAEPHFPQKIAAINRHRQFFGDLPLDAVPPAAVSRPDWLGRPIREFRRAAEGADLPSVEYYRPVTEPPSHTLVPRLLAGWLHAADLAPFTRELVVAIDGRIVDVCPMHHSGFGSYGFSLLLPEDVSAAAGHTVELFLIRRDDETLQPLEGWQP